MLQQAELDRLVAEKKIGGDGQMRAEHDFLMDGVDADADRFMRVRQADRLTLPQRSRRRCADARR